MRKHPLSARLALLAALDGAGCALIIWRDRQQRRNQSPNKKEESP